MTKRLLMSDTPPFAPPEVTDDDICWASNLLNLPKDAFHGKDGSDPRQAVLKSLEEMDVAACPGSGKTTLLVAKLAILAEKWRDNTRGLCVLSHTNAARKEIETKLGNTTAGRRLLSYPHFIGTIHGFVNEFLAIPLLRSRGYQIKMIDTDLSQKRRWLALPPNTRAGLETNGYGPPILSVKSPDFGIGPVCWGKKRTPLRSDTDTYKKIRDVCRQSSMDGYFCYDEMFVWAGDLMDKVPGVVEVLRNRFPLLFIDEAQDNTEDQSAILHRIFLGGGGTVIRQRFGDANQAIFNFVGYKGAESDFPDDRIKTIDLPTSHRFGQTIADLADPLALVPHSLKAGDGMSTQAGEFRAGAVLAQMLGHGFGARTHMELFVDVHQVCPHGGETDVYPGADLLVGKTFGQQGKNFRFASGELAGFVQCHGRFNE